MFGGRGDFEMDGLKRAFFCGDEIAEHGDTEIGLRVAELELGVERGFWRDEADQDPLILFAGMLPW